MRFPLIEQIALPVRFERYLPGALHPDGRRYLPQLVFQLASGARIGIVDRHHYVDPQLVGRDGVARLVWLQAPLSLQPAGEQRQGIGAEPGGSERIATAPPCFGRIAALPSWEPRSGHLPYETLFVELLLDVGDGVVGVRTNLTADDMAAKIGAPRLAPGDWIAVERARIDILGFEPAAGS